MTIVICPCCRFARFQRPLSLCMLPSIAIAVRIILFFFFFLWPKQRNLASYLSRSCQLILLTQHAEIDSDFHCRPVCFTSFGLASECRAGPTVGNSNLCLVAEMSKLGNSPGLLYFQTPGPAYAYLLVGMPSDWIEIRYYLYHIRICTKPSDTYIGGCEKMILIRQN